MTYSPLPIMQEVPRDDGLYPRQPTLLSTFGHVSQERDRALQPTASHSKGSPSGVVEREMERHEGSAANVTFRDEGAVGAFSGSNALLEMACPKRSLCELLYLARPEHTGRIGLTE